MPVWRCGEWTMDLSARTAVMGILNVTPDSFSDGGRYNTVEKAAAHALRLAVAPKAGTLSTKGALD